MNLQLRAGAYPPMARAMERNDRRRRLAGDDADPDRQQEAVRSRERAAGSPQISKIWNILKNGAKFKFCKCFAGSFSAVSQPAFASKFAVCSTLIFASTRFDFFCAPL